MNPGPWGMAQTGIPFGEVAAVRDWLGSRPKLGGRSVSIPSVQLKDLHVSAARYPVEALGVGG